MNLFAYSDTLESVGSILDAKGNERKIDALIIEETLQYIENEDKNYIQKNGSDWLAQFGNSKS